MVSQDVNSLVRNGRLRARSEKNLSLFWETTEINYCQPSTFEVKSPRLPIFYRYYLQWNKVHGVVFLFLLTVDPARFQWWLTHFTSLHQVLFNLGVLLQGQWVGTVKVPEARLIFIFLVFCLKATVYLPIWWPDTGGQVGPTTCWRWPARTSRSSPSSPCRTSLRRQVRPANVFRIFMYKTTIWIAGGLFYHGISYDFLDCFWSKIW